jgi:uncharacterized repeat protein (TIGR03943 family)
MSSTFVPASEVTLRSKSFSPRRVGAALVLGAWAGLFWFLLVSGRTSLYLSNRTDWVVPVGAVILTAGFIGRLLSARTEAPEPLGTKDAFGLAVVIIPVVVIMALPPVSLTSYATSRRSSFSSAGFSTSAADIATGDLSLVDVAGAQRSREGMGALVKRAGSEVSFIGFVTRDPGMPADEFILNRFLISCCVADALSIQVRVANAPPGKFARDDWVQVTGKMYPLGREVIVAATEVTPVDKPEHPYLNP